MDITIINISKGSHNLNKEILKEFELEKLSFNITSRLRYSVESNYVGFQIDLLVMQENTQVFKSGFLIGMVIKNWSEDLKKGLDLNSNRDKLTELCKSAWLVATGIVALQSSTEQFPGIILPPVDFDEFSRDVILLPAE